MSGYRVVGGPGPTVADLEELAYTCRLLEGAAARLDTASWTLMRASQACDPLSPAGIEARRVLVAVCAGPRSPWRAADHLRDLAAALRQTIELYTEAESLAHRALRAGVVAVASELGERPLLAGTLGGGRDGRRRRRWRAAWSSAASCGRRCSGGRTPSSR